MSDSFKVGDHVSWNSDLGRIVGKIVKVHRHDVEFLGKMRRASTEEPQFEVRSDKTGAHAMHKLDALTKLPAR